MPRSESDKLAMTPLKVKLGAEEYKIEILRTAKAREWRALLTSQLGVVLQNFSISTTDTKVLSTGLIASLMQFPEKLTDLLFAYASDWNQETKDKILAESTEEQIGVAFSEVMACAFPFLAQLGMVTEMLKSELSHSPKAASSILQ